jgi:GTPase SAR1 family protein
MDGMNTKEKKIRMEYHPAKKEIRFFIDGKPYDDGLESFTHTKKGSFLLIEHGEALFPAIAKVFNSWEKIHIEFMGTELDCKDLELMIDNYNNSVSKDNSEQKAIFYATQAENDKLPSMAAMAKDIIGYGEHIRQILIEFLYYMNVSRKTATFKYMKKFEEIIDECISDIAEKIKSMSSNENEVNLYFAGIHNSGKTALINAILGVRLLVESNNPETSTIYCLKRPKPGEPESIIFPYKSSLRHLNWDEEKKTLVFEEDIRGDRLLTAIQKIIDAGAKEKRKKHRIMFDVLKFIFPSEKLLDEERTDRYEYLDLLKKHFDDIRERITGTVNILYDMPIPSEKENFQLAIYDMPGTDSNNYAHEKEWKKALDNSTHSILIYVMHPDNSQGFGNQVLLSHLKNLRDKSILSGIDLERSIFVVNKCDTLNHNQTTLEDFWRNELPIAGPIETVEIGQGVERPEKQPGLSLSSVKLLFTSAVYATAANARMTGDETDYDSDFLDDEKKIRKHRYFKHNRIGQSENATTKMRNESENEMKAADSGGSDNYRLEKMFYVASGMFALREEVQSFGRKHAMTLRAYAIIKAVENVLSKVSGHAFEMRTMSNRELDEIKNDIDLLVKDVTVKVNEKVNEKKAKYESEFPLKELGLSDENINSICQECTSEVDKAEEKSGILNKIKRWFLEQFFNSSADAVVKDEDVEHLFDNLDGIIRRFEDNYQKKRDGVLLKYQQNFISEIMKIVDEEKNLSPAAKNVMKKFDVEPITPMEISQLIAVAKNMFAKYQADNKKRSFSPDKLKKYLSKEVRTLLSEKTIEFKTNYMVNLDRVVETVLYSFDNERELYSDQYKMLTDKRDDFMSLLEKTNKLAKQIDKESRNLDERIGWRTL